MTVPAHPKLYHITHVDNLPGILADGGLWSDAAMIARGGPAAAIGMGQIKERRLALPVRCHPGDQVGDYVPFYFCPRSIMLYLLYQANHPGLTYRGGQSPIVHLEADLHETVAWTESEVRRWAFSLSNAEAFYTEFRDRLDQLGEVNWAAVAATDFRDAQIKEGKQAEFLLHGFIPWHLVRRIGVHSLPIHNRVAQALAHAQHRPAVEMRQDWYF
ncbi:MAG: DUF4433 domain-containing protein [Hydrogenophilales bacterium CG_4_10_14_3_um_filter_63_21]|nr:MAG: DUF4433 domain-containing protein [Hydrogenophilales bacterium CG_4_10_14_3_um_filter_63_21]